MSGEQKIRAFLFYISLFIFFAGLPFILSFALGYKFNRRTFKFTKAGLIALKTQPQRASIYLNGVLLNDKTPATINELLPGEYNLRLELENHYPWTGGVTVEAGKVSRLDKIIFFPLRPNIKQMNKERISAFWLDKDKGAVFYVNEEGRNVYESDLEGENFHRIGSLPQITRVRMRCKVSGDKQKLLCYGPQKIAIENLEAQNASSSSGAPVTFNYSHRNIMDVFWHSDSYHLVVVTDRNIEALEAEPNARPVNIVNLNRNDTRVFYDDVKDAVYFLDREKAQDGKIYNNAYKLELGPRLYQLQDLIKARRNE